MSKRVIPSICFTGHRPQALPGGYHENHQSTVQLKKMLADVILKSNQNNQAQEFISGMALGVDTWAAELVLSLKDTTLRLTAAIPWPGQCARWPAKSQERYWAIIQQADRIVVGNANNPNSGTWDEVSYEEFVVRVSMQGDVDYGTVARLLNVRNHWMVNNSQAVIGVYNGSGSGGTFNCIQYARKHQRPLYLINPVTFAVTKEG